MASSSVYDVASLILYGTQAIPVRLKILLDRLFASVSKDDVNQILLQFGWSKDDYDRGYSLNDHSDRSLCRFNMCSREEEQTVIRNFFRFPETQSLAAQMMNEEVSSPLKLNSLDKQFTNGDNSGPKSNDLNTSSDCLETRSNPSHSLFSPNSRLDARNCKSADGSIGDKSDATDEMDAYPPVEPEDLSMKQSPNLAARSLPNPFETLFHHGSSVKKKLEQYLRGGGHSGKRRVQCPVCLKTFCDKGALKIHHSAVHLKEMHKCTVKGCTMMFSSRRSRNRHSSNPNPKLHTTGPSKSDISTHYRVISPPAAAAEYQRLINGEMDAENGNYLDQSGPKAKSRRKSFPTKLVSLQRPGDVPKEEPMAHSPDHGLLQISFGDEDESSGAEPLDLTQSKDTHSAIRHLTTLTETLSQPLGLPSMAPLNQFSVSSLIERSSPLSNGQVTPSPSPSPSLGEEKSPDEGNLSDSQSITMTQCKTPSGTIEIPINESNPRQCTNCGKTFQNHFSVKTHYQNVHLKLMHKCIVPGCNAAFPSKRSRDRHSSNMNLHRKLLSGARDGAAALQRSIIGVNNQQTIKRDANGLTNGSVDNDSNPISPPGSPPVRHPDILHQQFYPYPPALLPFAPQILTQLARSMGHGPQPNPFLNPWAAMGMAMAAGSFDPSKMDINSLKHQQQSPEQMDTVSPVKKEVPASAE